MQVWARYWTIPPDFWRGTASWAPPEKAALDATERNDLGIAFSGGGTRAATAALGQLRALHENGWLKHVRYMTAVSGGSWTSVPFVYSTADPEALLGKTVPPQELTRAFLTARPAEGTIAHAIVNSGLYAVGALEAGRILVRAELDKGSDGRIPEQLQSLIRRFVAGRTSETYANMLGRVFIRPILADRGDLRYSWNASSFNDIKATDGDAPVGVKDFVLANRERPFLIVGGTMIYQHPAYGYPRLIPIEYTPLYTGVRQQYGERLGGIYVSPFAYDAVAAATPEADRVRVTLNAETRPFSLADVIASSGAAPLLALYRGVPARPLQRATVAFPSFNHFTVRSTQAGLAASPVVPNLLHGDGGFSDNLGVMPLLARKVHNVIVFVNGAEPFTTNESIESLFFHLNKQEDSGGDRSMNGGVFGQDRYWEVVNGLNAAVKAGQPPIYCDKGWTVGKNEIYNVAEYDGLNICWVHNEAVPRWNATLPSDTQEMLREKPFRNFPWFSTFEQNRPSLIKLHAEQVNLLSQFTSWMLTAPNGRATIEEVMGAALR
jgi:hypothetical protein